MVILASLIALAGAQPIFDPACAGRAISDLPAQDRQMTTADLARLRDIGTGTYTQDSVGLSVSPDGRRVAFQMREADTDGNRHCLSIIIASLDGETKPLVVDRGGDLIRQAKPQLGIGPYPSGVPEVIRPIWSPDGRYVAFLKRSVRGGKVQVWVASADGRGTFALDHGTGDATNFHWQDDSRHIGITSRQLDSMMQDRDREALSGYHMDERLIPVSSAKPYFKAPFPIRTEVVSLPVATISQAPLFDAEKFEAVSNWHEIPIADIMDAQFADGSGSSKGLCPTVGCASPVIKAWKTRDGMSSSFLRREGLANDGMALYYRAPHATRAKRVFQTSGILVGCEPAGTRLVCAREEASQPRRIVIVDPKSGKIKTVFDPNPEFHSFARARVKRLYWRNDRGILTFGDLVLPPDHKPGEKHPLVVVTYRSRGFLRGGIGDEYPIFPLAARGYAVLSFDNPPDISSFANTTSVAEAKRLDRKDWINRKSILSSIETGVRTVEALGVSDPSRRAITGLSDGSSSLFFALINDDFFQTAIASTCCEEPISSMALIGEVGADYFEENGYPLLSQDDTDFWRAMSVSRNAARIDVPLLLNLADDEYLYALESIRALRFYRRPVDAYLYPNEFHVKWQPAHRLSIYDRNIAWFDFWLRGIAPADDESRQIWEGIRNRAGKTSTGYGKSGAVRALNGTGDMMSTTRDGR